MDSSGAGTFTARVQEALDTFAAGQRDRLAGAGPSAGILVDAALASASGGKRLRASFCSQGWLAAGGDEDPRVVVAAASLEWLQASALVHDDLIDGSDTRRGRPSMHRHFAAEHRAAGWRGDPHGYGSAAAILLGDLMLTWSDEMFRCCGLPAERVAAALPYLDACRSEVVAGQFLDVVAQASGSSDVQTAMRVLHFKSAKYTVERPLHLGAALAGADEQLIGALSRFGLPLGEAFQLRDDVLGVFGDEGRTGKPAGDDLREGKRTVLLAHAHIGADDAQRDLLDRLVGQPDLDAGQVEQLRAVIVDTGALQAVEEHIGELHDAAVAALDEAPVAAPARTSLRELAERSVRRAS
jgi:geranylgeranyl diphosphate synthase type I